MQKKYQLLVVESVVPFTQTFAIFHKMCSICSTFPPVYFHTKTLLKFWRYWRFCNGVFFSPHTVKSNAQSNEIRMKRYWENQNNNWKQRRLAFL